MSEFVKDRLNLVMGQQGGLVADGGGQVAADEAEVGATLLRGIALAREQVVHPRAATFRLAGVPVGVEGAELLACLRIEEVIEFDLRVPGLDCVE